MSWTDSVYAAIHRQRPAPAAPELLDVDAFAPGTPNLHPIIERASLAQANQLNVRVSYFSNVNADLLLTGSVRQLDGSLIPIGPSGAGFAFTTTGDRSVRSKNFALGFGIGATLNSLRVIALTAGVQVGQIFVIVEETILLPDSSFLPIATLIANTVTTVQPQTWPGGTLVLSTAGEPVVRVITSAAVAAGQPIHEVCPVGARWELITFFMQMVTAAGGVNRNVFFQINYSGGSPAAVGASLVAQAPSTTQIYTVGQNFPLFGAAIVTIINFAFPQRQFMRAGDEFFGTALNIAGADQLALSFYQVREWLEPTVVIP